MHLFLKEIFMKSKLLLLSFAMTCAFSNAALAMTKDEYKTQKDAISSTDKANRENCKSLKDNAKDICMSEAKGAEKIAKAELEATYKPSARNTEKVSKVKHDAAYDTAKEKCDDSAGDAKSACMKEAKTKHAAK